MTMNTASSLRALITKRSLVATLVAAATVLLAACVLMPGKFTSRVKTQSGT
jgi:hypothetical protein